MVDQTSMTGVEREMRLMYQQPHLVPPMKLTVFDGLPPTPTPAPPSHLSQWMSQGKASLRSSLSLRRHTSSRQQVSSPQPPLPLSQQLPLRRAASEYRPLELSIYMPNNRLSDLPEFDRMSFTEVGEIKLPPRALVRTKSEEFRPHKVSMLPAPVKPASMIEQRGMTHRRPDISSTVISISRPPSEYDALHSHPVSWSSLPGLPPPAHVPVRPEGSVAVLSPMQEEFTPPAITVAIGETVLSFPKAANISRTSLSQTQRMSSETSVSAPVVPSTRNFSKPTEMNSPSGYFHPNYQTQKRISQWLANRSHSSSISTTKSSSTSASFAEHRRKRSQFYQLSTAPPKPLTLWSQQHQRTMTESTVASSVDTDIVSLTNPSQTDTTVTAVVDLQSRSSTIKSLSKSGLRPIVSGVPDMPPCYAEVINAADGLLIKEIGGPLRSPGVGVAF